ncbi:hypothetical protein [Ekhidna sp.]|uniref:anti-sigma factor family protein n=1 Tax=Ekhidna sp. TaxID=2608089 RepID=UPI0032EBDAD6
MSYKPEESTLIAYLYDELEGADRKKVEEYLSGNVLAQKELEELKDTLSIMGHLKDKEVEIPTFTFENASQVVVGKKSEISFWRRSFAIAASIALVMLIGYVTEFKVAWNEGFQLSFGESATEYNQQEVESMIAAAIEKNNKELDQRIENTAASLKQFVDDENQSFQTKLTSQVSQPEGFESQRKQYLEQLRQLVEASELAQKKYTDQVLMDFAIFLDMQRQNDLEVIQTRFDNLQNNTELNQLQTNQILANLISTVEDPNQY